MRRVEVCDFNQSNVVRGPKAKRRKRNKHVRGNRRECCRVAFGFGVCVCRGGGGGGGGWRKWVLAHFNSRVPQPGEWGLSEVAPVSPAAPLDAPFATRHARIGTCGREGARGDFPLAYRPDWMPETARERAPQPPDRALCRKARWDNLRHWPPRISRRIWRNRGPGLFLSRPPHRCLHLAPHTVALHGTHRLVPARGQTKAA